MNLMRFKRHACLVVALSALCMNQTAAKGSTFKAGINRAAFYGGLPTAGALAIVVNKAIQAYRSGKPLTLNQLKTTFAAIFTNQKQLWVDDKFSVIVADLVALGFVIGGVADASQFFMKAPAKKGSTQNPQGQQQPTTGSTLDSAQITQPNPQASASSHSSSTLAVNSVETAASTRNGLAPVLAPATNEVPLDIADLDRSQVNSEIELAEKERSRLEIEYSTAQHQELLNQLEKLRKRINILYDRKEKLTLAVSYAASFNEIWGKFGTLPQSAPAVPQDAPTTSIPSHHQLPALGGHDAIQHCLAPLCPEMFHPAPSIVAPSLTPSKEPGTFATQAAETVAEMIRTGQTLTPEQEATLKGLNKGIARLEVHDAATAETQQAPADATGTADIGNIEIPDWFFSENNNKPNPPPVQALQGTLAVKAAALLPIPKAQEPEAQLSAAVRKTPQKPPTKPSKKERRAQALALSLLPDQTQETTPKVAPANDSTIGTQGISPEKAASAALWSKLPRDGNGELLPRRIKKHQGPKASTPGQKS